MLEFGFLEDPDSRILNVEYFVWHCINEGSPEKQPTGSLPEDLVHDITEAEKSPVSCWKPEQKEPVELVNLSTNGSIRKVDVKSGRTAHISSGRWGTWPTSYFLPVNRKLAIHLVEEGRRSLFLTLSNQLLISFGNTLTMFFFFFFSPVGIMLIH